MNVTVTELIDLDTFEYVLECTDSSAGVEVTNVNKNQGNMVVYNEGPNDAFLVTATTAAPTAVAPVAGTPKKGKTIPAGQAFSFKKNTYGKYFAGICATGETARLHISVGGGQ